MKLALLFCGMIIAVAAHAEPAAVATETNETAPVMPPVEKTITDTRVEYAVENIYTEVKSNKPQRAELLFAAAKRGYSNACLYVGNMFDKGVLVKKSPEKAFAWFNSCARRSPIAAYDLAVLYAEGRGVPKDMEKAVTWFKASWPALKGQTPQTAVRLAYYYLHKKDWAAAWEWADLASQINNKKHGDYVMAKLLANGNGRQEDIPQALLLANNAVRSYNPNAALLVAWIYASGKTDEPREKAIEMACGYEAIAAMMETNGNRTVRYCGGEITAENKQRAEEYAKKFMADQKAPPLMDFTSTLDGREAQFTF